MQYYVIVRCMLTGVRRRPSVTPQQVSVRVGGCYMNRDKTIWSTVAAAVVVVLVCVLFFIQFGVPW